VVPVGSVRVCTRKFCAYFTKELGLNDFQVNTPFPAGPGRRSKDAFTSTTPRTREVSFRWIPKERRALRLLGYQLSQRSFWQHISRARSHWDAALLRQHPARREFVEGPKHLVEHADCLSCAISRWHCPVRTYSALGTMLAEDPYCEVHKAIFGSAEIQARQILRSRLLVSDVNRPGT
jgi:hypothetical protein